MRRPRVAGWLLVCLAGVGATGAEWHEPPPRVRVQFRLVDPTYSRAFRTDTRRRHAQDSAATMIAGVLGDKFRFLTFTAAGDTVERTLIVELGKPEQVGSGRIDAVGLYLALVEGGVEVKRLPWMEFEPLGLRSVDTALFGRKLQLKFDGMTGEDERTLLDSVLGSVSIADTSATAWKPPAVAGEVAIEWLIPYTLDSVCFDPRKTRLLVRNLVRIAGGEDDLFVRVKPSRSLTRDAGFQVPGRLERFRGLIRAAVDSPPPPFVAPPPESITVRAVYVAAYAFDRLKCAPLRRPGGSETP